MQYVWHPCINMLKVSNKDEFIKAIEEKEQNFELTFEAKKMILRIKTTDKALSWTLGLGSIALIGAAIFFPPSAIVTGPVASGFVAGSVVTATSTISAGSIISALGITGISKFWLMRSLKKYKMIKKGQRIFLEMKN